MAKFKLGAVKNIEVICRATADGDACVTVARAP
jgi:hypothetical protein